MLATLATANDVHFGETECGKTGDPATDAIGPVLRVEPGATPYPVVMNGAIVAEMHASIPTRSSSRATSPTPGRPRSTTRSSARTARSAPILHHVRGNHDAIRDRELAQQSAPYAIELSGVTVAVLDTTVPGRVGRCAP